MCDSKSIPEMDIPGTAARETRALICGASNTPVSKKRRLLLAGVRGRTRTSTVGDVAGEISMVQGLCRVHG